VEKIYEKYGNNTYHYEDYSNIYEYIVFMNGIISLYEDRKITNLYNFQKNTEYISEMIKNYKFSSLPIEHKSAIFKEIENGFNIMVSLKNDYLMPQDLTMEFAKYVNFLHIAKIMTIYFLEEDDLSGKNTFLISLFERNQTDDIYNPKEPIETATFVKYQPVNDIEKQKIYEEMNEKYPDVLPYLEKEYELSNTFPFENTYFYGLNKQLDIILNGYGNFLKFSQDLLPHYFSSENEYINLVYEFIPKKLKYNIISEYVDYDIKKISIIEKLLGENGYQEEFLYLLPIIYVLNNYEIEKELYETIFKIFLSDYQSFNYVKPLLKKEVFDKFGAIVYFERAVYTYIRLFLDVLDFSNLELISKTIDEKSEESSDELKNNFKLYGFLNMSKSMTLDEILDTGFFESADEINELLSNEYDLDANEFVFKNNNNLINVDDNINLLSKKVSENLSSSKNTVGFDKLLTILPGIDSNKPIDVVAKSNLDNLRLPPDFSEKLPKPETTNLSDVLGVEKISFDKYKKIITPIEYQGLEDIVKTFGEVSLSNVTEVASAMNVGVNSLPDVKNLPESQKCGNSKKNKKLPNVDEPKDEDKDMSFLEKLNNKISQWTDKINKFSSELMGYANAFQEKLQVYANKLSDAVNKNLAKAQKWLDTVFGSIQDFLQKYIDKFTDFVNSILGPIQALFDMVSALLCLLKALLCLLGMLLNLFDTLGDTIDNLGNAVAEFVGSIEQMGADMIGALKSSISGALGMFGLSPNDLCSDDGKSFMESMEDSVKKWAEEQEKIYSDMFEKMLEDGLKCKIAAPKFHFDGLKFNFSLSFPKFKLNMPSC